MKRTLLVLCAALGASACATAPVSFTSPTPASQDDAYSCALRKINEMGFTVANTDRQAGFITAEKQTSGLGTALLTGKKYQDQLTVSIFDNAGSASRTIRVTAAQTNENAIAFGSASRTGVAPSDTGKKAAQELLTVCAPNAEATQQTSLRSFQVEALVAE